MYIQKQSVMYTDLKATTINIRVSNSDKEALMAKAKAANMTLTDYLVSKGLEATTTPEVLQGINAQIAWDTGRQIGSEYLVYAGYLWRRYPGSRAGRYQLYQCLRVARPLEVFVTKRPGHTPTSTLGVYKTFELALALEAKVPETIDYMDFWLILGKLCSLVDGGDSPEDALDNLSKLG